ncbi:MAG: hypothetical protein GY820_03265, partial [Gammaproteobacteria bacterium]|nr:hypothetical protein [Gammaproteobacteria bacterium]
MENFVAGFWLQSWPVDLKISDLAKFFPKHYVWCKMDAEQQERRWEARKKQWTQDTEQLLAELKADPDKFWAQWQDKYGDLIEAL